MKFKWNWSGAVIYTFIGLLGVAVIGLGWLMLNSERILMHRLLGWCDTATDSLYDISIAEIRMHRIGRNITAHGIRLHPDTSQLHKYLVQGKTSAHLVSLDIPELEIKGIGWFGVLLRKTLSCNTILSTNAQITIRAVTDTLQNHVNVSQPGHTLKMKSIQLSNPSVLYINEDSDSVEVTTGGGKFVLQNVCFNPHLPKDSTKHPFDLAIMKCDSLIIQQRNGMYSLKAGAIDYSDEKNEMHIAGLSLKPMVSRDQFYRRIGHQKNMYDFECPSIRITGTDLHALATEQTVIADRISISHPRLLVFHSLIPVPDPKDKLGTFPNELLQRCNSPIYIKQVSIDNAFVKYTEVSHITRRAGEVSFTEVQSTINNITNIPASLDSNSICTVDVQARSFGQGRVSATVSFPLGNTNGAFRIKARQESLDLTRINRTARYLALLEFESMDLRRFDIDIKGNAASAEGNFTVIYNELNITAFKMDDHEIVRDPVKTFLLRNLMTYPHNPLPGKEIRTVYTIAKRDPYKSFFNLAWKCTMVGMVRSWLRSENYADKILEKQIHSDARRRE